MPNLRPVTIGYQILIVLIVVMGCASTPHQLAPCGPQRPAFLFEPWTGGRWCVEQVVVDPAAGPVGYAHLTAASDGTLYATLPERGQVAHVTDANDDRLLDTVAPLVNGLTRPVGIDYHDGALYIAGNANLYRYELESETLTVLADDIPWGWTGYPTGGVLVHVDQVYVAAGGDSACTPGRGAVYRYNLDGGERQTVVTGIRAPSDIAPHAGALWVSDAATDQVMQIQPGADYGACGDDAPPNVPTHSFSAGSAPFALASYTDDAHEQLTDGLLVTLRGSPGEVIVNGYAVEALLFEDERLLPEPLEVVPVLLPHLVEQGISQQRMHIQGSGFYPDHVYGLAVDANGWVYVSYSSGGIIALRTLE